MQCAIQILKAYMLLFIIIIVIIIWQLNSCFELKIFNKRCQELNTNTFNTTDALFSLRI